jgi:hypothetical protein
MQSQGGNLLSFESTALLVGATVVIALAYLQYRREVLLIETGYYDEDLRDDLMEALPRRRREGVLIVGLLVGGYGLGKAINALTRSSPGQLQYLEGEIPFAIGLALVAYFAYVEWRGGEAQDADGEDDDRGDGGNDDDGPPMID